jgi:AraC-like DNA-binding protein
MIPMRISLKITTEQLADFLYMNRQYLCERFKRETGMTVGQFLTGRKIDEAKRLLRTTGMSIAQISEFLSFSSQSHFQNVFKRITGVTPKAFRESVVT